MNKTKIEWTEVTWNPVRGCSPVSAGCENCYAARQALRFAGKGGPYEGLVERVDGKPQWTGKVRLIREKLEEPLRWRKPRMVFVNSMSDVFHEELTDYEIKSVFSAMNSARRHTFQVLTKRPKRAEVFNSHFGTITWTPNIWFGISAENQSWLDERLQWLRKSRAAVKFVSFEPLLGPIPRLDLEGIDWVIVGGESGPNARPMHPDWARGIRDECVRQGVPFFFKQWGEWEPLMYYYEEDDDKHDEVFSSVFEEEGWRTRYIDINGGDWSTIEAQPPPTTWVMYRMGTKKAGRLLDGREWNEMPRVSGK